MPPIETIESSGFPLCFKVRQGKARSALIAGAAGTTARDVFLAEARQIGGHQKECVVHEGAGASVFRAVSDEGAQLKGTDLAPFPLGFYNAGLNADLVNRILGLARARAVTLNALAIELHNRYYMTGSFFKGTGVGSAEPAKIKVRVASPATSAQIDALVRDAAAASPALATMRVPLENTFALYVNGRRRPVTTMPASPSPDAADPYVTYRNPPAPQDGAQAPRDLIHKTGATTPGEFAYQVAETKDRVIINVWGDCRLIDPQGVTETVVRLGYPRTSHFAIRSDERASPDTAPSGLAHVTAGIVFCYITQLLRYIEHQKLKISGVRVVQSSPYTLANGGGWSGGVAPVDTHLFLNGEESEETYEKLMTVAARTCYLHATLGLTLPPEITVEHGEQAAA
jgi:uncharacterized OsmC-like protein